MVDITLVVLAILGLCNIGISVNVICIVCMIAWACEILLACLLHEKFKDYLVAAGIYTPLLVMSIVGLCGKLSSTAICIVALCTIVVDIIWKVICKISDER